MARNSGQVVVEYMLLVLLVLISLSVIGNSVRTTVIKLWKGYANQITGACPGCEPPKRY